MATDKFGNSLTNNIIPTSVFYNDDCRRGLKRRIDNDSYDAGDCRITNVKEPEENFDAVNKRYVDLRITHYKSVIQLSLNRVEREVKRDLGSINTTITNHESGCITSLKRYADQKFVDCELLVKSYIDSKLQDYDLYLTRLEDRVEEKLKINIESVKHILSQRS